MSKSNKFFQRQHFWILSRGIFELILEKTRGKSVCVSLEAFQENLWRRMNCVFYTISSRDNSNFCFELGTYNTMNFWPKAVFVKIKFGVKITFRLLTVVDCYSSKHFDGGRLLSFDLKIHVQVSQFYENIWLEPDFFDFFLLGFQV